MRIPNPKYVAALKAYTCNVSLGMLQDDPQILQSAIDYLEKYARAEARVG